MSTENQTALFSEEELINLQELSSNNLGNRTSSTSGRSCSEKFERLKKPSLWAKKFVTTIISQGDWFSDKCVLSWKLKGTKYRRYYCQVVPNVHTPEQNEFDLLPTPLASSFEQTNTEVYDARMERIKAKGHKEFTMPLDQMAIRKLLPTPRACESIERRNMKTIIKKVENGGDVTLTTLAKYKGGIMLPTPTVGDYQKGENPKTWEKRRARHAANGVNLHNPLRQIAVAGFLPTPTAMEGEKITGLENQNSMTKIVREMTGKTSQLNPRFVAEMMGFPPNWTELPFLNGNTEA
jgi:hypothetical protein